MTKRVKIILTSSLSIIMLGIIFFPSFVLLNQSFVTNSEIKPNNKPNVPPPEKPTGQPTIKSSASEGVFNAKKIKLNIEGSYLPLAREYYTITNKNSNTIISNDSLLISGYSNKILVTFLDLSIENVANLNYEIVVDVKNGFTPIKENILKFLPAPVVEIVAQPQDIEITNPNPNISVPISSLARIAVSHPSMGNTFEFNWYETKDPSLEGEIYPPGVGVTGLSFSSKDGSPGQVRYFYCTIGIFFADTVKTRVASVTFK